MKQISILGCGWLGFPLAKSLVKSNFSINGSTTSKEKLSILKNEGISPFLINLLEDKIEGDIKTFLENSELLIIDIPPKLRGDFKENFVSKIATLLPFIEKSSIKKVIFVSSTSVYSDVYPVEIVSENLILQPNTESGKQLVAVEQNLLSIKKFDTIILRFGGLIGDDRNPIKFLSGKKNIENPKAPINLIHLVDCIGCIENILLKTNSNQIWNQAYNAVYPFHPTRKEYYCQKAVENNLDLPQFDESKTSVGKIVLSKKIQKLLGYTFVKKI